MSGSHEMTVHSREHAVLAIGGLHSVREMFPDEHQRCQRTAQRITAAVTADP